MEVNGGMKMRRCVVCGSDEVLLWLGGSIGALYRCPECQYVGPIVIEGDEGENVTAESLPREEQARAVRDPDNRLAGEDLFRT